MESFSELKNAPPIKDTADEEKFTEILRTIFQRHAHVVPTMARSVLRSVSIQATPGNVRVPCLAPHASVDRDLAYFNK